ncbi:DUF3139 domain-containing protein [Paenibacillus pinihumi]|uniref:YfjL-like protein n=1 Tax=Paenibacillus pinihumi TaxID=669462 RepID=UPI0003F65FFB|nr:DUF3139 domain-containing protein [Paenibacillus pinihumi]
MKKSKRIDRKKMLYSILLGLLVVLVLFLYNAFNGNPMSKWIAHQTLEKYLEQNYPELKLRVHDGYYNFKDSGYTFKAVIIGGKAQEENKPGEFEFSVRGSIQPAVRLDGIYYSRLDRSAMERLSAEAAQEIKNLLLRDIPSLQKVDAHIEVLKGQVAEGEHWIKTMRLAAPLQLNMLLDVKGMSKEELLETVKHMQNLLHTNDYRYESVMINANLMGTAHGKEEIGAVKYAVRFKPESEIRLEDIREFGE